VNWHSTHTKGRRLSSNMYIYIYTHTYIYIYTYTCISLELDNHLNLTKSRGQLNVMNSMKYPPECAERGAETLTRSPNLSNSTTYGVASSNRLL